MEPILRCAMSCPEMSLHKVLYGFWLSVGLVRFLVVSFGGLKIY
jgi:hypothetical protein